MSTTQRVAPDRVLESLLIRLDSSTIPAVQGFLAEIHTPSQTWWTGHNGKEGAERVDYYDGPDPVVAEARRLATLASKALERASHILAMRLMGVGPEGCAPCPPELEQR